MDDQIVNASSRMITYLMIETGKIQTRYPWTTMENIKEQIETSIVKYGLDASQIARMTYTMMRDYHKVEDTAHALVYGTYQGLQSKLELQNSGPKGRGVFATVVLHRGTMITKVEGTLVDEQEMTRHRVEKNPRVFYSVKGTRGQTKDPIWVLGINEPEPGRGLGSFVNDAMKGDARIKASDHNAELVQATDDCFYVRLLKDIQPGQEILVRYGKQYWMDQECL